MQNYAEFDYDQLQNEVVFASRGRIYDDNVYTFDIETTSVFSYPDRSINVFDFQQKPDFYTDTDKLGFMYIWQFSINDQVIYGRTWEQFRKLLIALKKNSIGMRIVYVHNLAFEFQFLRNIISDFDVFAREPRHPIVARSDEYGVEFRCSLMLTNAALANVPKMYDLPVEKKTGDLDYHVIRNQYTQLTAREMSYCEYDCLVVYHLVRKMKQKYGHIYRIPLTQTGELRRVCQRMYHDDSSYKNWLRAQLPTDIEKLVFILRAFSGGYTHANSFYTGEIMRNVHSKDITSSYPTVMIAEKYPVTRFMDCHAATLDEITEQYCWIVDIEFFELYSVYENNYLSLSKATDKYHAVADNGRVVTAERLRITITDVDLWIIRRAYKWSDYKIHRALRAEKGYLNRKFISEIIDLYGKKTSFKGLEDRKNDYMQSKQFINSMYGMMVTNLITDMVQCDDTWTVHQLTTDEAQEKLDKINSNPKTFVSQPWGVFVTAYARKNLWTMIMQIDSDVIYCDTDSIKYIHDHEKEFSIYNAEIIEKLRVACSYHGISAEALSPADTHGKHHPLGVYDTEQDYTQFVTLGAKKYADTHADGKIEITVSGVNKKGAAALKKLSDFKKGFCFDYWNSGKNILTYNDEQQDFFITDNQGNTAKVTQKYGINLMPTEYTIGMSEDYERLINSTLHYSGGGF